MSQAEPPRYSRRPFPAYRFIPGKTPHPTRDPDGHSYGHGPAVATHFDVERWYENDDYLYGVDLYNHGYWWEAHEAWESCWAAAGKQTPAGLFLQGLIQITAGCLKKHQGFADAGRRLAQEGLDKFPLREGCYLGIELHSFRQSLLDFFAGKKQEQPLIELTLPNDRSEPNS